MANLRFLSEGDLRSFPSELVNEWQKETIKNKKAIIVCRGLSGYFSYPASLDDEQQIIDGFIEATNGIMDANKIIGYIN